MADERLFDNWFDPIETALRAKVRGFIETLVEEELETALARPRYGRRPEPPAGDHADEPVVGHRHGHRMQSLTGTFGPTQIAVPRARIVGNDGKTTEWKSKALRAYQRRTRAADALIASTYLSGTNTRRVRRALAAVFAEEVGKQAFARWGRCEPNSGSKRLPLQAGAVVIRDDKPRVWCRRHRAAQKRRSFRHLDARPHEFVSNA